MANQDSTSDSDGNQIVPFSFEDQPIRTIQGADGEVWFVAGDVCKVLGIINVSDALSRLDGDERHDIAFTDTIGRLVKMNVVNESGLYTLILRSNKPEVKAFKRWVTHEVLPSIRKTGSYNTPDLSTSRGLLAAVQKLVDIEDEQRRQSDAIQRIEARIDAISADDGYYTVAGYFALRGKDAPREVMAEVGKRASALSRQRNIPVGKHPHPNFGEVGKYHESVLKSVLGW